jgi:hypothetical protein
MTRSWTMESGVLCGALFILSDIQRRMQFWDRFVSSLVGDFRYHDDGRK